MPCDCIFCFGGIDHPDTHHEFSFYTVGGKSIEMCYSCGHIRAELILEPLN